MRAFSVDRLLEDAGRFLGIGRRLRILLLLDRHHVESVERSEHGATNPSSILPVQGSSDLDLSLGGISDLLLKLHAEALIEALHQRCAAS